MQRILMIGAAALAMMVGHAQANLLVNGDFTDGVTSETAFLPGTYANAPFEVGGALFGTNTNDNVPFGWMPDAAFVLPQYNGVGTNGAGLQGPAGTVLVMGNPSGDPLSTISQTFDDQAGVLYQVSLAIGSLWLPAEAQVAIDGIAGITLTSTGNVSFLPGCCLVGQNMMTTVSFPGGESVAGPSGYSIDTFSFLGTGSDMITLSSVSDYGDGPVAFYGVSVDTSPVPEPSGLAMVGIGLLGLGYVKHRKSSV